MDTAAANAVVNEVDRLFALARGEASFWTETGRSIDARLDTLEAQIAEWKTTKREWAAAGGRLVKGDYSWTDWSNLGKAYCDELAYLAQTAADYSVFGALEWNVKKDVDDLKKLGGDAAALLPTAWPWWVWVLVAVGVLGYAGNAFAKVRR